MNVILMDETILLWINHHYNDYWDAYMPMLTYRFAWIPMYIALAYAVVRTLGWKRGLIFIVAIALTTLIADQMSSHVIRPWAQRLRPSNLDNPISAFIHVVNDYRGYPYGMPSSHAANTVGLLTMLTYRFKNRILLATFTLWMLMQVYSRMYLGVHYPTDILVGALVGFVSASLVFYFYKKFTHERRAVLKHEIAPEFTFVLTLLVIAVLSFFR